MNTLNRTLASMAMTAGLSCSAGLVQAADLTYAIGYTPGTSYVDAADAFAAYSAEHGGPTIEVFPMTLLNIKETPPGIRDNIVDMGFNAHGGFQAEYPNANLPAEFGVRATDAAAADNVFWGPAAMAGAITEYIMLDCPDCTAEFAREGQVYLSGQASGSYALHCSQEITTLDQIKGKQIRTPSGYWDRWVQAMGGVSVFMTANEAFSALSQGVVDCVVFQPGDLLATRLIDVVKATTLGVPQGVYSAAAVNTINQNVWRGLPADQRKVLMEASGFLNAEMTFRVTQNAQNALDEEAKRGIPVNQAAPDLADATTAFVDGLREVVVADYASRDGMTDVDAKVDTIFALIDKWVDLTKDAKTADDLFQIYLTEIYAKVDVDTYGM